MEKNKDMKKIYAHNMKATFGCKLKSILKPVWMMLVLMVLGTTLAFGQVSVQVVNSTSVSTVSQNNTISYIVPEGANRMLLLMISNADGRTVSTITFNGTSLTPIVTGNDLQDARTHVYRFINPPTGPGNLVVNFSGGVGRGAVIGAITLSNVDQTTPIPYSSSTSGTTAAISHSVTSENGQLVLQVVGTRKSPLTTPGTNQTQLWNLRPGTSDHYSAASHKTASGTPTTMTWDRSALGSSWSMSLVSVKPACITATVSVTNPTCSGGPNGSITVSSPTGGTGSYQYQLNTGIWQSSNTFTGLAPGTYSVQIRDANNTTCTVSLGSFTLATSPVVFEAVTSGAATTGTVGTVSHTTGSNAYRLMLVGVSTRQTLITVPAAGEETLNVTYGGNPLTYVGSQTTQEGKTYIFMMVDPPSGTANVSVTFASTLATGNAGIIGVTTYSNVNLNAPLGAYFSNVGGSTAPSLTITSTATNQRIFNVLGTKNSGWTVTLNSGQTQRWFSNAYRPTAGGYGLNGQAGSTASSYTLSSSDDWSLSGVAINPALVADLAVAKTVDHSGPYAGQQIAFTLTATNLGCDNAPNAIVIDLLPSGYTYVSHSTVNGTYNGGSGEWAIGTLNSGSTATLTINAVVNKTGVYTNIATISADAVDNSTGNNTASISITLCQAGGTQPLFNN